MTTTVATAADPRVQVRLVRRGARFKADIKSVEWGSARAILKDFAGKPWLVRLLGRMQIAREIKALDRLRGIPGVPACYGRWAGHGILLERVEGDRITRFCGARRDRIATMFARLESLIGAIHARGVVHLDLRKRDNILIDAEGRPGIIDFNAAVCFVPGGPAARRLFTLLRRIDTSALLKWKQRIAPELVAPSDRRLHRRMALLRRLWIFN